MVKSKPFDPDVRTKKVLTEAAEIAHQELSISLYANRRAEKMVWPDRQWEWAPIGPFHTPTGDFGTATASDLDASDQIFWAGWGTSSAIGQRKVGRGSIYYLGFRDQVGKPFDGDKTYKLNIPGSVPAELFWSVTVYDLATRCLIETQQGRAAVAASNVEALTAA